MLFEFPAPGLKKGIRGARRSGSTIPAILLPEGEEAALALGDSERMLESAYVVRTRIAQVESLSFGRVPELIESSHIWHSNRKIFIFVWCEFYYGRGFTIISSGSQASSEGIEFHS